MLSYVPRQEPCGAVAQLGERLLCKQGVTGSSPVRSTGHDDAPGVHLRRSARGASGGRCHVSVAWRSGNPRTATRTQPGRMNWIAVVAGGALGAALRYAVGSLWLAGAFPWGTLVVNVTGSFALG